MIVNAQRKVKIDTGSFEPFVRKVLDSVDEAGGAEVAVAFVSDRRMKQLNKDFRGKQGTTDVLSFPQEPDEFAAEEDNFLGDIVISLEQAAKQAGENGLTLENEIKQLILHGVLHLCGYDHEADNGEMNARELELREKLHI